LRSFSKKQLKQSGQHCDLFCSNGSTGWRGPGFPVRKSGITLTSTPIEVEADKLKWWKRSRENLILSNSDSKKLIASIQKGKSLWVGKTFQFIVNILIQIKDVFAWIKLFCYWLFKTFHLQAPVSHTWTLQGHRRVMARYTSTEELKDDAT